MKDFDTASYQRGWDDGYRDRGTHDAAVNANVDGVVAELIAAETAIQHAVVVLIKATNTLGALARLAKKDR